MTVEQFEKIYPVPALGRELGEMLAFWSDYSFSGDDSAVILAGKVSPIPFLFPYNDLTRSFSLTLHHL